jgi:UDP-glucose 4-epimerase
MDYIRERKGAHPFNLGTGIGYSVKEVITAFEKASGKAIPTQIDPRRAGDLASVYANADRAKQELGFATKHDLDRMCADAWRWQQYASGDV